MRLTLAPSCVAVALFAAMTLPACADTIAPGTSYEFGFNGPGSSSTNGLSATQDTVNPTSVQTANPPYTFSLSGASSITVTDLYLSGDQFAVYDFGTLLGDTSVPTLGGLCTNDVAGCVADPDISHGTFSLSAGDHSITIEALASPFGSGVGVFEVAPLAPTPEPSSVALLGTGLLGVTGVVKRHFA